jgi:UDP-N-acetylmuramoyl-tripeptide--D-alanyl-D-alanine ligase
MNALVTNFWHTARKWQEALDWKLLPARAYVHRARCRNTKFVCVVGSSGKTTAKELTAAVLSKKYRIHKTQGNDNLVTESGPQYTVLATEPSDEYVVLEAGVDAPGQMSKMARFLRPDVAVMLCVKPAHLRGFGSLEAIASEKGKIFDYLSDKGTAIVNADDPLVMQEAKQRSLKLRTFGTTPGCDVELVSATSSWPERLQLRARVDGREQLIQTQLVGTHWANSVLAALAVGTHYGVTVEECANAIGSVQPFWSRMQPCELSNGVVVVRDEVHGEKFNYDIAFEAFRHAHAKRKVLLASTYAGEEPLRARMENLGRLAAEIFDYAIFIGERGNYAMRAAQEAGMARDRMIAFYKYQEAVDHIRGELGPGDLVLLKGRMDMHLSRLYLSMMGDVACTLKSCGRSILCDGCPSLGFTPTQDVRGPIAPPPRAHRRTPVN